MIMSILILEKKFKDNSRNIILMLIDLREELIIGFRMIRSKGLGKLETKLLLQSLGWMELLDSTQLHINNFLEEFLLKKLLPNF